MQLLLALSLLLLHRVDSCWCSDAAGLHGSHGLRRHALPELLKLLMEQGSTEVIHEERVQGGVAQRTVEPDAGNIATEIKWKKEDPALPLKERSEPRAPLAVIVTNLRALAGLSRRTGSRNKSYQKLKPQQSKSNQTDDTSKQPYGDTNGNTDVDDTRGSSGDSDQDVTSQLDVTSSGRSNELDVSKEKHVADELNVTGKIGVTSEVDVIKETDVTRKRLEASDENITVDASAEHRIDKKIVKDPDVKLEMVSEPGAEGSVVGSRTPARAAATCPEHHGPCEDTRGDVDWARRPSTRKTYNISFLFNR